MSYPAPIKIAVVGGDPLVGHAVELMLLSAGYSARFLGGSRWMNGEADPFEGFSLVLIAPRASDADRKALLRRLLPSLSSTSEENKASTIPVLELSATAGGEETEDEEKVYRVLWPCRVKDLKREIEGALLSGPLPPDQAG